jgi:hypothetical protein
MATISSRPDQQLPLTGSEFLPIETPNGTNRITANNLFTLGNAKYAPIKADGGSWVMNNGLWVQGYNKTEIDTLLSALANKDLSNATISTAFQTLLTDILANKDLSNLSTDGNNRFPSLTIDQNFDISENTYPADLKAVNQVITIKMSSLTLKIQAAACNLPTSGSFPVNFDVYFRDNVPRDAICFATPIASRASGTTGTLPQIAMNALGTPFSTRTVDCYSSIAASTSGAIGAAMFVVIHKA